VAGAVLNLGVTSFMLRLWRATWTVPFFYTGDAVGSAAHVKATFEWGWYEYQPDLGAPYGQHYHDYAFSDNLHLVLLKAFTPFTDNWPIAFNAYYVLAFVACGLGMLWFLRREGVGRSLSLALSVLYAVAPYHFWRNEAHLFLGAYWTVPLTLVVVMAALRGEPLWRRRTGRSGLVGLLTGRGAAVAIIMVAAGSATAYYAVFGGILLAFAGFLALGRTRSWRRFGGVVAAGALLVAAFVVNLLPDLLYARQFGPNPSAVVRGADQGEVWGFKLTSLLLPAQGHPIAAWAKFRETYDATHPLASERPALGLTCAVALVAVFVISVVRIAHRSERAASADVLRRRGAVADLCAMSVLTFLLGTVGGLGAMVSFLNEAIRGWNRTSIFLSALLLGVVGLVVEGGLNRARQALDRRRGGSGRSRLLTPAAAALLLLVGVADQQVAQSVPPYAASAAMWNSDEAFVRQIEATVPAGSMIFQLPFMAFPESGTSHEAGDADLLKPSLHSTSLRWSLGGIKGRPETDWGWSAVQRSPQEAIDIITKMGFAAIVIDRAATPDHGAAIEAAYAPYAGSPGFTSQDGRWAFLSLQRQSSQAEATAAPEQRQAYLAFVLAGGLVS
jgi:phosphoglycerol transferase